jgi:uncharacterized tellurite resistance protein B-like protein
MKFWHKFIEHLQSSSSETQKIAGRLQAKVEEILPNAEEKDIVVATCIAGLLVRVAYADLKISESEQDKITESLEKWTGFDKNLVSAIAQIAKVEMEDLSGVENHLYCDPLNNFLSDRDRSELLKCLFAVAASDGDVEAIETEEIRQITRGLNLEHQHFVAAKFTVAEKLKALKN